MKQIDLAFLNNKIIDKDIAKYRCEASSGNINIIADNIVSFDEFNFLNGGDTNTKFDGHYTFYVNINTFDYVVLKSADYGGFTWVNNVPDADKIYFIPHPNIKSEIDSLVADKLLGAYFFDHTHVNQQGKNLYHPAVKDEFNNYPGRKYSLLCDYMRDTKDNSNSFEHEIIELLQNNAAFSEFEQKQTEKNKSIIPNPYIRSAKRMQYRCLYATVNHSSNWLINEKFGVFYSNPLKRNINDLEYKETNKRLIQLKLSKEIKTKSTAFKLYNLYLDKNLNKTVYLITKNNIIIYAKDSSHGAEADSAFHTLTEVYSNGYNENMSWVWCGLNDAEITDYLWDGTTRKIDYVKVTDVQKHIDKLYCHY